MEKGELQRVCHE
jgi:hypothetical protein